MSRTLEEQMRAWIEERGGAQALRKVSQEAEREIEAQHDAARVDPAVLREPMTR
jgi:hypothetical protein